MSIVQRTPHLAAAVAIVAALSACQATVPAPPMPSAGPSSATIQGRLTSPSAAYQLQFLGSLSAAIKAVAIVAPKGVDIGVTVVKALAGVRGSRYALLADGQVSNFKEVVAAADGSWKVEVPAGPVTLKLFLEDGTIIPLTFPSGTDASHWLKVTAGGTYDLGQLGATDDHRGATEHNPLASLDSDGDGVPDAEDLDDDGDGTPDTEETGAMRYDPSETVDTDRDGLGDNSDPSPTDSGHRGAENQQDADGDGLLDLFDLDGDGKLDDEVFPEYVFV